MSSKYCSFDKTLINYKPLTKDGLIMKKLMKEGFGAYPGKGMEVVLHLYAEAEDGRVCANTRIVHEEPRFIVIGKLQEFPGLEIAVKSMRMGETSSFKFSPEYTYFSLEKFKKCDKNIIENLKDEAFKTSLPLPQKTPEEIKEMEIDQAKKYMNLYYDIELVKFDKPRPRKINCSPKERYEQAIDLKKEGNDLFKEKRFMEAIVKYKDAREYLKQMPNDFITDEYHNLQHSITLNITNCHINLSQYNYALQNLEENFLFNKTPKAFYFKSLCQMHLGDFENSYKNLLELQKIMVNEEKQVKIFFDDYYKFKEETINQQKKKSKKGIFESHLYQDKKDINEKEKKNKYNLPKFNPEENFCFYFDFLLNGDEMNPQKVKFEIFDNTKNNIINIFEEIKDDVEKKKLINKEINFDFSNSDKVDCKENVLTLWNGIIELKDIDKFGAINKFPLNEDVLLLMHKKEKGFDIEISTQGISNTPIGDYIAIGRCYYNHSALKLLNEKKVKGSIKIIDMDEAISY